MNTVTSPETNARAAFAELTPTQKETLLSWIVANLAPSQIIGRHTSREIKAAFERSGYFRTPRGFFVSANVFHGAMLTANFGPIDPTERFWRFRYQAAKGCRGSLYDGEIRKLVPCHRAGVDVVAGNLCSYHARRGEDYFPLVFRMSDLETFIKKHGCAKHPPLPRHLRGGALIEVSR